jgi:hypothetical protein
MKLPDNIASTNVDFSCLGKTVPITSPEAEAAQACLNEVTNLKDSYAQSMVDMVRAKGSSVSDATEAQVRANGEDTFDRILGQYISIKNRGSSSVFHWNGPADTYEFREEEFSKLFNPGKR